MSCTDDRGFPLIRVLLSRPQMHCIDTWYHGGSGEGVTIFVHMYIVHEYSLIIIYKCIKYIYNIYIYIHIYVYISICIYIYIIYIIYMYTYSYNTCTYIYNTCTYTYIYIHTTCTYIIYIFIYTDVEIVSRKIDIMGLILSLNCLWTAHRNWVK